MQYINQKLVCFNTGLTNGSPYYFGNNITNYFAEIIGKYHFDKLFFISNEVLVNLYGEEFFELFRKSGLSYEKVIIKDSESTKNFATLEDLCETLIAKGISKGSIIIALGGGCIGNIVGLAAGLIYRGIRYIEIPTTLMALSDSTLSNKQAVNGRSGKNQLGIYYAPLFIWGDTKYIKSEHELNIKAAIVEGIKNGFISDPNLLAYFKNNIKENGKYTEKELNAICYQIIQSKLKILERDPTEKGYGIILEYGHTFGHAIEWLTRGRIIHGIAVAIGMCIAAELSHFLGFISQPTVNEHYHLFKDKLGLNLEIPENICGKDIIKVIESDNKKVAKGIKYVLLKEIGECCNPDGDFQVYIEPTLVEQVIDKYIDKQKEMKVTA